MQNRTCDSADLIGPLVAAPCVAWPRSSPAPSARPGLGRPPPHARVDRSGRALVHPRPRTTTPRRWTTCASHFGDRGRTSVRSGATHSRTRSRPAADRRCSKPGSRGSC